MKTPTAYTALLILLAAATPVTRADPHAAWNALLGERVKDGVVDYAGLHKDPARLDAYLATLAATDPSDYAREDQLAYWINAYNAFTIRLILDHYPTASIRDVSRPWKRKQWNAGGTIYSLDHIEHTILRKQFKEPRIHFAIVCASIGCPDLQPRAFTGPGIETQLEQAARHFMQSPKHVRTAAASLNSVATNGFTTVQRSLLKVTAACLT